MNVKEMLDIMDKTTLETLAEDIKKTPAYPIYEKAVISGKENSNNLLGLLVSIYMKHDEVLATKVDKVAWEILYAMLDQRYRAEIKKMTAKDGNP